MRRLMWFTVGFAAACVLCAYTWQQQWILPVLGACLLLTALGWIFGRERKWIRIVAAVFLGGGIGFTWFLGFQSLYLKPAESLQNAEQMVEISASGYSWETNYGTCVDGIIFIEKKPYQIRTYLKDTVNVEPGDILTGVFSFRLAQQDRSSYFSSKGIFLFAYQREEMHIVPALEIPFWCYPAVLRNQMQALLDASFPSDTAPFAKALLLGDGADLDYAQDTAFKISGIRHIIAVSGLHISILYELIHFITLRRRFLTAVVGFPVLLVFAAVAGFTPSVVRACIMVWLMLLARIFDREYDSLTALAFSALVMLAVNPLAAASVSLQLSVSCVAGILLFHQPIYNWLKKKVPSRILPNKLRKMLLTVISVSLGAVSLVTPLSAGYFEAVSLVSVITNILTLWVVNLVFYGLIAVCLVYLMSPMMATVLGSVLAFPMRYVLLVSNTVKSVPLAAVYMQSIYIVAWLVFVYILLAVFLLSKNRYPGILLCCGTLGLCAALVASWAEPLLDSARITMLDVGQGQSILLQSEGRSYLVDCGGDDDEETADIIAETLLSQGIRRLDGIILTHYDRDHSGALDNLLTRVDTQLLILPDTRNTFVLPETDAQIIWVWEDLEISFGNSCLSVYGPVYSGMDNENSLCVLFDTQKYDILITGDRTAFGERMLMRRVNLPDVNILVAGHHGAADSTSEELLNAVTPETVLISVEENNVYGHPSPELLQRLEKFGCRVYRTDQNGTILIRR